MTPMLIAMRATIIWWVTLSLTPIEVVFDARVGVSAPRRAVMRNFGNGLAGSMWAWVPASLKAIVDASHGEQLPLRNDLDALVRLT